MPAMKSEKFSRLAYQHRWKIVGKSAVGEHHGYPFSVFSSGQRLFFRLRLQHSVSRSEMPQLRRQQAKGAALRLHEADLLLSLRIRGGEPVGGIAPALDALVRSLRAQGQLPPQTCPICGDVSCDAVALFGSTCLPTHSGCVQGYPAVPAGQANKKPPQGSVFGGIIGALLGLLMCCAAAALVYVKHPSSLGVFYAMLPILSYNGYVLLGGHSNKIFRFVCLLVAALLGVLVIEQIVFYIACVQAEGALPNVAENLNAFWQRFNLAAFISKNQAKAIPLFSGFIFTCYTLIRSNKPSAALDQDVVLIQDSLLHRSGVAL